MLIYGSTNTEMLPILHKWSTKIQAATLQVNSRQAGSSRFLASTRSAPASVVEAIEAGLSARREKAVPFYEAEEIAALLESAFAPPPAESSVQEPLGDEQMADSAVPRRRNLPRRSEAA